MLHRMGRRRSIWCHQRRHWPTQNRPYDSASRHLPESLVYLRSYILPDDAGNSDLDLSTATPARPQKSLPMDHIRQPRRDLDDFDCLLLRHDISVLASVLLLDPGGRR